MYNNETSLPQKKEVMKQKAFICFHMNDSYYALDIHAVNEIVEIPIITPYPIVIPGHIGVVNLSGQILPIIDFTQAANRLTIQSDDLLLVVNFANENQFGLVIKHPRRVQVPPKLLISTTVNIDGMPVRILEQHNFTFMECPA